MPDLDLRFDTYTEQFYDQQLAALREQALTISLPERLSLEIGSNKGMFLRGLAKRYPEREYLGIEIRAKYTRQANDSYAREGIPNARVLRADGNLAIPILIDDGQISELFALYPDPWWKARHRKRRLIQPAFLDLLERKMHPGAKLWIRTDVGVLANDMRDTLNSHRAFRPTPIDDIPMTPFPRSERDVRSIAMGIPVQLVYYTRC